MSACKSKFRFQIHLTGRFGLYVLSAAQEVYTIKCVWDFTNKYSCIYMSLASGAIVKLRKNIHVKFLYLSEKYCQVLCKSYYPILTARCESEINSEFHLKKKKKRWGGHRFQVKMVWVWQRTERRRRAPLWVISHPQSTSTHSSWGLVQSPLKGIWAGPQ